jgi:predicted nucleic acid-binding protein
VPFSVVYDACVLHSAPLRDLLLRVAQSGIVQARWSSKILDECFESIARVRPDLEPERLERTRRLMEVALPAAMVYEYESLIDAIDLPDVDDRHVVAAAIRAGAQAIVTFNLKHFPATALSRYDIDSKHPDQFVLDCLDLAPAIVAHCVREQADSLRNPPRSIVDVLAELRNGGLVQSVARLNELFGGDPPSSAGANT